MFAQSNSTLEVIGGVCDPVGSLLLGAFSRTVGREQGFESFRLSLHLQAGPLGGGLCWRLSTFRGSRRSCHIWTEKKNGYIKNMSPPGHPYSVFKFELKTSLWFAFTLHMMSQECFYKRALGSSHHRNSMHWGIQINLNQSVNWYLNGCFHHSLVMSSLLHLHVGNKC